MVLNTVDVLIDALREVHLLRPEQLNQIVNDFAARMDPQELGKHLVRIGWLTVYQAKKLFNGHGPELVLGSYIILDKLGEGGMGKVYKAKQLRLNRIVALKVVRPNLLTNEMALKRFQREAKAAAQLAHPNIVRLFDADQVGDRHFLAMEFIDGADLSAMVKESGPLPVGLACSFIRQAAIGLQHAHDLGLIHRDIKPSNLLVTAPTKNSKFVDAGGVVKILDMGLARVATSDPSDASALTQDGTVIGTPDFMSPEQGKNSSLVDARSDLYSLGCTMYYLLTGQPPFPSGATLEKLLQHQIDQPTPIEQLRQNVPPEVCAIVRKLLAKRTDDRYQSGSALATALDPWSKFDAKLESLKPNARTPVPETTMRDDLPVACTPVPEDVNPFKFEATEPPPAPEPAPAQPTVPVSKAKTPLPQKPPKKRWSRWKVAALAVGALLSVVGVLAAAGVFRTAEPPPEEQAKVEPLKKEPTLPPVDAKAIDYYLPADAEAIAVLNVQNLNQSKFFRDSLLPKFKDFVALVKKGGGFDPFRSVERVIVAVPPDSSQSIVVIQGGPEIASPAFLAWAAKLPGASVTPERMPGQSATKDIYCLPNQDDKDAGRAGRTYAAVLSNASPAALVLSASKERVLEALGRVGKTNAVIFKDPSLRQALARYPAKSSERQSTLWLCVGGEARAFGPFTDKKKDRGMPSDAGIVNLIASFRLTETLMFELEFDAKTRAAATAGKDAIAGFFLLASLARKDDLRLARLADLLQNSAPTPRKKDAHPTVHQWWRSVSSDKLVDWLAPFLEGKKTN
jgi:eukaryotic-like serine/threonine-protein kinase